MEDHITVADVAHDDDGQTLVEYALILALISAAAAVLLNLGLVQGGIEPFFTAVSGILDAA